MDVLRVIVLCAAMLCCGCVSETPGFPEEKSEIALQGGMMHTEKEDNDNTENKLHYSIFGGYAVTDMLEIGGIFVGSGGYSSSSLGTAPLKVKSYLYLVGPTLTLNFGSSSEAIPFIRIAGGMVQGYLYWKLGGIEIRESDRGAFYGAEAGSRFRVTESAYVYLSFMYIQTLFDDEFGGDAELLSIMAGVGFLF
jgi:hypothetical protein